MKTTFIKNVPLAVTSFFKFLGYFGENLSNSISTPNFIMIELETTKLGGGGGGGHNASSIL